MSAETCSTETCATPQKTHSDDCCDMHEKLLILADDAWMELMKEKIKAEINKASGPHMEKIAQLVVETNFAKWSDLIQAKTKCNEYKDNLKALMAGGCEK